MSKTRVLRLDTSVFTTLPRFKILSFLIQANPSVHITNVGSAENPETLEYIYLRLEKNIEIENHQITLML